MRRIGLRGWIVAGLFLWQSLAAAQSLYDEKTFVPLTADRKAFRVGDLLTVQVFETASAYARDRGVILADTKFEFGRDASGAITLIDEVLTPDSSRYWPAEEWKPGSSPPSFDKQIVRDWLETSGWNKEPPPPALPEDVVARTSARYREILDRLTK